MDLNDYVDRLIEEKKFPQLTPKIHEQIKADLLTKLHDTINAKTIAALSDSDLAAFNALLDKNAPDQEVQSFVEGAIPDSAAFLTNVLLEFRNTYLGLA